MPITPSMLLRGVVLGFVSMIAACGGCEPNPTDPMDLPQEYRKPGEDGFSMVIQGYTSDQGLRIVGPAWNDVWVRDCRIKDTASDGVFIRDVERVKISGCEISGVRGQGGIRLSATGGSRDVTLEGNHIHDVAENGINASQRADDDVHHERLIVRDNFVERTGLEASDGLTHGLYIQSREAVIEGNTVLESMDGNGISIRSTITVRRNIVRGWAKSGIRYYSDHDRGEGAVLIENNMVRGQGSGAAIEARFAPEAPERFVAREIVARFNTIVSDSDRAAIGVGPEIIARAQVRAEGNLVVGSIDGVSGTNAVLDPALLVSPTDLHLRAPHPERGAFDALDAPTLDLDAQTRPAFGVDPGADQVAPD